MEASIHPLGTIQNVPAASGCGLWADPVDLEKEILAIGLQLKGIVSSKLVGEISDQQYQLQAPGLVEQYRVLTQIWREAGFKKHVFAD